MDSPVAKSTKKKEEAEKKKQKNKEASKWTLEQEE